MVERLILLTGATGYIGGRLLHALEVEGRRVRGLSRHPDALSQRVAQTTEVVKGDVLDGRSLSANMVGVHTAYYLVHEMASPNSFEAEDGRSAYAFAAAARVAGVQRIVYLGGLGFGSELSAHLRSRQEVGRILRESGVPTIEFRASIVIGSGSASFEMMRALVEKLPVMTTPRWVKTRTQPIAIEDVIAYLIEALDLEINGSRIFEIGGYDQVSYLDLMKEYSHQRGLKRWMIPVPVLSPRLSSLWLGLVTPVYARVGRELVDSLRNETIVRGPSAGDVFAIRPRGYREALKRALANEDREFAETRWSDAFSSLRIAPRSGQLWSPHCEFAVGARALSSSHRLSADPAARGKTGWYFGNWLCEFVACWTCCSAVRVCVAADVILIGSSQVILSTSGVSKKSESDHLLRLAAEMRLPGRAWLRFEIEANGSGSLVRQTAIYDPVGVLGQIYWYLLYPMH